MHSLVIQTCSIQPVIYQLVQQAATDRSANEEQCVAERQWKYNYA